MAALHELGLVESCNLHEEKALHYMLGIERQYANNSFHNRKHAADVVQTILSVLLNGLEDVFTPVEQLTLLLSAAVHDVGHQGLTNDFHESTMGELAVTYNGQSPNEHYHAATATRTLLKEHNNFLPAAGSSSSSSSAVGESAAAAQPAVTLPEIRSGMVQAILGTDLKNHEVVMHKAEAALDKYGTNLATWPSAAAPVCADPAAAAAAAAVAAARRDILTFIVHVADVSNVMKPRGQAIIWANRFIQECQEQGDKETLLGFPNNFLTARPGNLPQSQKAFLEYFGCKCAAALERIAPKAGGQAVANCQANLAYWKEQL